MPAPSKTQYARMADAEDHIVCKYKGLRATVLYRLHASGFDTNPYSDASEAYRQTAFDKKSSATTRQESKQQYVAEKRKVLRALAASTARNVTAKSQQRRHRRICASKSSSGSTQQRRLERNKQSEQVPVFNFRRACDDKYQEAEQTLVCVAIADNEEHGCDKNAELVVKAEQPSDIAITLASSNQKVQCAEHVKTVIEETERASVDFEDALLTEACVWPTFANKQRADNAADGDCVGAAEQLSAIALQMSAHNNGVECCGDGQVVIEEVESSAATSEDSYSAKDKSAAAPLCPVLSFGNNPAAITC